MRRVLCVLVALLSAAVLTPQAAPSPKAVAADRIWFSPNPGTLDLLRMFDQPDEWKRARALVQVYNFTGQHTFSEPPPIVGPNSYEALVRVDAFRKLRRWGKKISIGVGSVKEGYCTSDASGMDQSVADTLKDIDAVSAAGGAVSYLSMDEPWVSGRSRRCGGPALEPTADRVAFYMSSVSRVHPTIAIGLIEAYPFSGADAIESMLTLLQQRSVAPAFLHMDVDWHALKPGDFARDMKRLQTRCRAQGIPFGIILTGYNGDADALFAVDVYGIARQIAETFLRWSDMPDHIMFDSWVQSASGLNITPSNLPDNRPFTQTNLLVDVYRYLRGVDGVPSSGTAVPR
jgi:hypothetical protein